VEKNKRREKRMGLGIRDKILGIKDKGLGIKD